MVSFSLILVFWVEDAFAAFNSVEQVLGHCLETQQNGGFQPI